MTNNPNELTIENSVLMLVDHQPWVAFAVQSIDRGLMVNNVAGLAQMARDPRAASASRKRPPNGARSRRRA